jgi:ADP-heptose:LPS heptosyltransferase
LSIGNGRHEARINETILSYRSLFAKSDALLGEFDAGPDAFLDTAAIIANLDLVVTCDTSMAHLAGALGRRTLLALKHAPEWRWMLGRADTPWYSSLRLFRCAAGDDWAVLFDEMAATLGKSGALVTSE